MSDVWKTDSQTASPSTSDLSVKVLLKICLDGSDVIDFLDYPAVTVYQEYTSATCGKSVEIPDTFRAIQVIELDPRIAVAFYGMAHIVQGIILTCHSDHGESFIFVFFVQRNEFYGVFPARAAP